jgi:hypothetical protein
MQLESDYSIRKIGNKPIVCDAIQGRDILVFVYCIDNPGR